MAKRAVLFDFFGTLVQYHDSASTGNRNSLGGAGCSQPSDFSETKALLEQVEVSLSTAEFRKYWSESFASVRHLPRKPFVEFSILEVVKSFFVSLSIENRLESGFPERFVVTYLSEWQQAVALMPEALSLLQKLSPHYTIAVVSNTHSPDLVQGLLDRFQLSQYVDHVVTSIEVGFAKPHPAPFKEALRRCEVVPDDAIFIGDSFEDDVIGARGVEIDAVHFSLQPGEPQSVSRWSIGALRELEAHLLPVAKAV